MVIAEPVQLGYRGVLALDAGDIVCYKVGDYLEYCPAEVVTKPNPGATAVEVKLQRPYYCAHSVIPANVKILAGVSELYWDRHTKIPGLTIESLFID